MSFEVYDYRTDLRNILVTPQIRSRFLKIDVGDTSGASVSGRGHSHDLGHEIFLILQGEAEFEIEGHKRVVTSGQLCVALVDEVHTVRNVGEVPVIMYLSVTPHIQPTHTNWTDTGEKAPPKFNPAKTYDVPQNEGLSLDVLVDRQLETARELLKKVEYAARVQESQLGLLKQMAAQGDEQGALDARDAMWEVLEPMFQSMFALANDWNALTYKTAEPDFVANAQE